MKIKFVAPKDVIISQSENITLSDIHDEYDEEKAFFYIILNGNFKVSCLKFNKRKKESMQTDQSVNDFMNTTSVRAD